MGFYQNKKKVSRREIGWWKCVKNFKLTSLMPGLEI